MPSLQHSLTMGRNSWHARWYRTWVGLGGEPPKFKENLCHYVRVLLFWAPLRYFLYQPIVRFVTPAIATAAAAFIGGLTFVGLYWPGNFMRGLTFTGIVLGLIVAAVAAVLGLFEWSERFPKGFKLFWRWVFSPLWGSALGLKLACKWAVRRTYFVRHAFVGWYFYRFYFKVLNPSILTMLAALTAAFYLETDVMVKVLTVVGEWVGGVAIAALILMVLLWVKDRKGFWSGVKDTVKLGATYMSTKKQGSLICPFIEFEAADA